MKRKNGISLLVATQNSVETVEMCIRSFIDFADEIIAVDNGSNDGTIEILEKLENGIDKLQFFNKPNINSLYANRQFAFKKSKYRWVMRCDSDYVAYTSGVHNITILRDIILNTKPGLRPKAFELNTVNLFNDFYTTGTFHEKRVELAQVDPEHKHTIPSPLESSDLRVYQYNPFLKFKRLGRWEGVAFKRFYKRLNINNIFYCHCSFKRDMDHFFRSERTNWRELGDFKKYPTLRSYIESIIEKKYDTNDLEVACTKYIEKHIKPFLMPYNTDIFLDYPDIIKKAMSDNSKKG